MTTCFARLEETPMSRPMFWLSLVFPDRPRGFLSGVVGETGSLRQAATARSTNVGHRACCRAVREPIVRSSRADAPARARRWVSHVLAAHTSLVGPRLERPFFGRQLAVKVIPTRLGRQ